MTKLLADEGIDVLAADRLANPRIRDLDKSERAQVEIFLEDLGIDPRKVRAGSIAITGFTQPEPTFEYLTTENKAEWYDAESVVIPDGEPIPWQPLRKLGCVFTP